MAATILGDENLQFAFLLPEAGERLLLIKKHGSKEMRICNTALQDHSKIIFCCSYIHM